MLGKNMNIKIAGPWTNIPVAALYCGLGALASGAIFNKLSHLVEYNLNKTFGDYKNPKKTLDGKIIVSMPMRKSYYYVQNIALAILVAAISSKSIQILALAGCPSVIALPLLVGSVATPILFSLFNMIVCDTGGYHGRWIEISDAEINKQGINKSNVEKIDWSARVYCGFGTAPTWFSGELTTDSYE
jgi:hypothetical protein